jgi:hypothetical protein
VASAVSCIFHPLLLVNNLGYNSFLTFKCSRRNVSSTQSIDHMVPSQDTILTIMQFYKTLALHRLLSRIRFHSFEPRT